MEELQWELSLWSPGGCFGRGGALGCWCYGMGGCPKGMLLQWGFVALGERVVEANHSQALVRVTRSAE